MACAARKLGTVGKKLTPIEDGQVSVTLAHINDWHASSLQNLP